jgi:ATP-dependent RNA helicase DHX57
MYSRELFEKHMCDFDTGEMGRQPLDTVILGLRTMLNEKVIPILEQVLEPPPLQHIDRAFTSLHEEGLLSSPDDEGELTDLGSFVSKLGLDLRLGRLIGLGAMFGVLPEVVALASALSAPKSPFRVATELVMMDHNRKTHTIKAF